MNNEDIQLALDHLQSLAVLRGFSPAMVEHWQHMPNGFTRMLEYSTLHQIITDLSW